MYFADAVAAALQGCSRCLNPLLVTDRPSNGCLLHERPSIKFATFMSVLNTIVQDAQAASQPVLNDPWFESSV